MRAPKDEPGAIHLTEAERRNGAYSAGNLQSALEGLHQDGLLLLKSIVDVDHIDHLREIMLERKDEIMNGEKRGGQYNQGVKSNILQCPPVDRGDALYDDVYFNRYVIQIANAYLGSRPIWNFTTGNNALTGTRGIRQPVHKDITFQHPQVSLVTPTQYTATISSPEFWLGSHAYTVGSDQIPCTEETGFKHQLVGSPSCNVQPEAYESRRRERPPIQPVCEKGDVLIRDLRTWHAGMPNESNEDRLMIAIGYQAPWYPNHSQKLFLPAKHANFFMAHAGQPVEVRANLLEEKDLDLLWENYEFQFGTSI